MDFLDPFSQNGLHRQSASAFTPQWQKKMGLTHFTPAVFCKKNGLSCFHQLVFLQLLFKMHCMFPFHCRALGLHYGVSISRWLFRLNFGSFRWGDSIYACLYILQGDARITGCKTLERAMNHQSFRQKKLSCIGDEPCCIWNMSHTC